ncbi:MGMT family protein [Aquitalea aquatica]|uniref:MGMT family protein n=1 Tax=Aquitalea aquatica TaxID=3044273 RepID=A0A838Y4W7_9NEIS|nr:MGMT family protein [Aquitalea magnusonii]MBA4709746.1 MGMT family protein [Aquitalea magnusonii]
MSPAFEHAVLQLVGQIPPGRVSSYGVLAQLAGFPRHARHVGKLLGQLPEGHALPWYRVVSSAGSISRPGTEQADWQRVLLEQEGIEFSASGKISLFRYGWPAESYTPCGVG